MKTSTIILSIVATAFVIFIVWVGGAQKTPQAPQSKDGVVVAPEVKSEINKTETNMTTVVMTTNKGAITLELFADKNPKTVANFVKLAKDGFYNGTRFHRVIKGFMIQGGDPNSKDVSKMNMWGMGDPGYKFDDEIGSDNRNAVGTIAMANSGPNTNGSQFFINTADNSFLNPKHTAFGRVTAGMEVVTAIENTKTVNPAQHDDRPVEDMIVEKVEVK